MYGQSVLKLNSPAPFCSVSQSKGGGHLALLGCYLTYLQPVLFPPPSLCRDFDGPKVSLKAELFNSVSCQECLRRRWPCAICPQKGRRNHAMKKSSVWWSKVHDAGGTKQCQESLWYVYITVSTRYIKGNASCVLICIKQIFL